MFVLKLSGIQNILKPSLWISYYGLLGFKKDLGQIQGKGTHFKNILNTGR